MSEDKDRIEQPLAIHAASVKAAKKALEDSEVVPPLPASSTKA